MILSEEDRDDRSSMDMDEVAEALEGGFGQIVAAIQKLDLKVNVTVPKTEQKAPTVEVKANIPEIKIPELTFPDINFPEIKMPEQRPHPFQHGLTCEVVARDGNGDIKKFTIKPIKP
jgi:hypothetical protein